MSEPLSREERIGRARTNGAIVLALLAAGLFALAVPALWLERVVFDTDAWVETVAPLAADPAIQDAVATAASEAVIEELDANRRLTELLPGGLDRFAPVLASSVENAVRTQASEIVRSERFPQVWEEINRRSHETLLAAITGREGAVGIEAGTVTLDAGEVVSIVTAHLEERGLGFVSRISEIERLDRQVVLYRSETLARIGPAVDVVRRLALAIPIVAVALALIAFALGADRRRVALWLGGGVAVGAILPLQFLYLGQYMAVRAAAETPFLPPDSVQSAIDIVLRDLVAADQMLAVAGLLIWLGAVVAGPARWATALRSGVSARVSGSGSRLDLGPLGARITQHKRGLRAAGFVLAGAVLLLLPAPRTIAQVAWLAVVLVVWMIAVEFFGSAEAAPTQDEDPTA